MERLKTVPLAADDLTKAKNMLIAGFYNDMATISGRAQALGSFELFHGGWKNVFDVVHEYEAITPQDVMRVAGTYFTADNRTIVTLIPTPAEDGEEAGR